MVSSRPTISASRSVAASSQCCAWVFSSRKVRPVVFLKSPVAVQRSVDGVAEIVRAQILRFQHQAAIYGVRLDRLVDESCRFCLSGAASSRARSRSRRPAARRRRPGRVNSSQHSNSASSPPDASGGGCVPSTAGSAVTSTDLGLWNDGGVFSISASARLAAWPAPECTGTARCETYRGCARCPSPSRYTGCRSRSSPAACS